MPAQTPPFPARQETLYIASPCRSETCTSTSRKDWTLRLPSKILILILTHLGAESTYHESKIEQYLPLTQVCRPWRDIVEVLLYQTLLLRYRNTACWRGSDGKKLLQLLTALQKKPYLRQYTRSLQIVIDGNAYSEDIGSIMGLFPSIRHVSIQVNMEDAYLPLVKKIAKMELKELEFCGYGAAPSVSLLHDLLTNMPTLARPMQSPLRLWRQGWSQGWD